MDENFRVRNYQAEICAMAKKENIIACLPTGSGKTYIAVMLIKEMSVSIRKSLANGGKRTIFLVPTVHLVLQQSSVLETHTDLKIGRYYGSLGVDDWPKTKWDEEFEKNQVLFLTAQVFLDVVDHGYFSLNQVNLLIFDECHHSSGADRYAALMNKHYDDCLEKPRVLGLTASLVSKKIKYDDLLKEAAALQKIFRARIETSSDRGEAIKYGTSAKREIVFYWNYQMQMVERYCSLSIPFEILDFIVDRLTNVMRNNQNTLDQIIQNLINIMLSSDYRGENRNTYDESSNAYMQFMSEKFSSLEKLKKVFENLIEIGREIGLYGLLIAAKQYQKHLNMFNAHLNCLSGEAHEVLSDCFQRFNCLVEDILENLCQLNVNNREILFSSKFLKLVELITNRETVGQCLVFVQRISVTEYLCMVLDGILSKNAHNRLKVDYITGDRSAMGQNSRALKHQKTVIEDFRCGKINVLIATAVVEEGMDIPQCDLVLRFNKPANFSSYMQAKGRARARQDARYVLLVDQSDPKERKKTEEEFDQYDLIEKFMDSISLDGDDRSSPVDLSEIPVYCPSPGIKIDAIRAAQLLMKYCTYLGNGHLYPPRFLISSAGPPFTCILSMPATCPIREDITCNGSRKKLAKYRCCLEMIQLLHKNGELDQYCQPNTLHHIPEQPISIDDDIFYKCATLRDETSRIPIKNHFNYMKPKSIAKWSLYRIYGKLGFVFPSSALKIPKFYIFNQEEIHVIHLKSIEIQAYQRKLEQFCRYIFEEVFTDLNIGSDIVFDFQRSTVQLLPCFITDDNDIDLKHIESILQRKDRIIRDHSELSNNELYRTRHLDQHSFFKHTDNPQLKKKLTDQIDFNTNSVSRQTYADYFRSKNVQISFEPTGFLATMKAMRKARINYFYETSQQMKEETNESNDQNHYFPIEFLAYAPMNQADFDAIQRLPSLLVRISQLHRIEKLRLLFAENVPSCALIPVDRMEPVTFTDYFERFELPRTLRLTSLDYRETASSRQPSSDFFFQSVTRRSAGESCDMENFEILGDCFLKLAVTLCLYHRYPSANSGSLTINKAKQISNLNLFRLCIRQNLRHFINSTKVTFHGKDANWLPPGYVTNTKLAEKRYMEIELKQKAFADMIEAFIGVYFISTDYTTTLRFMKWLGIDVIPLDENDQLIETPPVTQSNVRNDLIESAITKLFNDYQFDQIESKLKYRFRQKAYLIAAFTHPSTYANRSTICYDRLEFLGDAVLDLLVTRYIFENSERINPGLVTDIRQDLSNNGRLAYIIVACGFHSKIIHESPEIFRSISEYAGNEELFDKKLNTDQLLCQNTAQWADSTAPKAFADVFEALVGAIFLDSAKRLDVVWNVIKPFLDKYLTQSINNPNFNPVRSFFEGGGRVVEERAEGEDADSISICVVETADGKRYEGRGRNKKLAKSDACQKAVR